MVVLGLLGLLALSSMAWLRRSDDDLPLVANETRLDALLAIGIASLEQMQRIQDDTWQGASTDSDDEIDDSVLANLQLPTSTDPPADVLSPRAIPSRASPHTPPAAHRRFCFLVFHVFNCIWVFNYSKAANSGPRTYCNTF